MLRIAFRRRFFRFSEYAKEMGSSLQICEEGCKCPLMMIELVDRFNIQRTNVPCKQTFIQQVRARLKIRIESAGRDPARFCNPGDRRYCIAMS